MRITGGKVFTGDEFAQRDVAIEDGRFVLAAGTAGEGAVVDATGCYVIPGLIDLHFHGCAGFDFCDGTPEALNAIARPEPFCNEWNSLKDYIVQPFQQIIGDPDITREEAQALLDECAERLYTDFPEAYKKPA